VYREAERRAPAEDRAEIAARLGWLTKELGDTGASRRYFARARGDSRVPPLTTIIIGVTVAVSFACFTTVGQENLLGLLWLDKAAVADGEYWRLFTVTLVHANLLHLAFNMYALWLAGPLVERFYGSLQFLLIYLLTAAAGSIASFVFGGDIPSVGASGAVFGLFGVLLAATRTHDPMVDRSSRMLLAQLGPLVLLNLLFGFLSGGQIDNAAHIGGLAAGLWLGWLLVPSGVPTLAGSFRRPSGMASAGWRASPALRLAGVLALVVLVVLVRRPGEPDYRRAKAEPTPTPVAAAPAVLPTDRVYPSPSLAPAATTPADGIVITMTAQQDCWVEVRADGQTLVNRVLSEGESQTFEARGEIVLSVGNAGGLQLRVNDQPALPLGRSGEVRKNIVITRQNLPSLVEQDRAAATDGQSG